MKDRIVDSAIIATILTVITTLLSLFIPTSKYVEDVGMLTVVPEMRDYYGVPFVFRTNSHFGAADETNLAMLAANVMVYFVMFFLLVFAVTFFVNKKQK